MFHAYADTSHGWAGWIEPADRSWIEFVGVDGSRLRFDSRDASGAVG